MNKKYKLKTIYEKDNKIRHINKFASIALLAFLGMSINHVHVDNKKSTVYAASSPINSNPNTQIPLVFKLAPFNINQPTHLPVITVDRPIISGATDINGQNRPDLNEIKKLLPPWMQVVALRLSADKSKYELVYKVTLVHFVDVNGNLLPNAAADTYFIKKPDGTYGLYAFSGSMEITYSMNDGDYALNTTKLGTIPNTKIVHVDPTNQNTNMGATDYINVYTAVFNKQVYYVDANTHQPVDGPIQDGHGDFLGAELPSNGNFANWSFIDTNKLNTLTSNWIANRVSKGLPAYVRPTDPQLAKPVYNHNLGRWEVPVVTKAPLVHFVDENGNLVPNASTDVKWEKDVNGDVWFPQGGQNIKAKVEEGSLVLDTANNNILKDVRITHIDEQNVLQTSQGQKYINVYTSTFDKPVYYVDVDTGQPVGGEISNFYGAKPPITGSQTAWMYLDTNILNSLTPLGGHGKINGPQEYIRPRDAQSATPTYNYTLDRWEVPVMKGTQATLKFQANQGSQSSNPQIPIIQVPRPNSNTHPTNTPTVADIQRQIYSSFPNMKVTDITLDANGLNWTVHYELNYAVVYVDSNGQKISSWGIMPVHSDINYPNQVQIGSVVPGNSAYKISGMPTFKNGRWEIPTTSTKENLIFELQSGANSRNLVPPVISVDGPNSPTNPTNAPTVASIQSQVPPQMKIIGIQFRPNANTWAVLYRWDFQSVYVDRAHELHTNTPLAAVNDDVNYTNSIHVGDTVPDNPGYFVAMPPMFDDANNRWIIPVEKRVQLHFVGPNAAKVTPQWVTGPDDINKPTNTPSISSINVPSDSYIKQIVFNAQTQTWDVTIDNKEHKIQIVAQNDNNTATPVSNTFADRLKDEIVFYDDGVTQKVTWSPGSILQQYVDVRLEPNKDSNGNYRVTFKFKDANGNLDITKFRQMYEKIGQISAYENASLQIKALAHGDVCVVK